jgi:predicted DNA-binding protein
MKQSKTIQLQLKPEIEARLINQATQQGLSIESYLESLIEDSLKNQEEMSFSPVTTDEDWKKELMSLINSPAFALAPPLLDAAISRDSIYTREDNLL